MSLLSLKLLTHVSLFSPKLFGTNLKYNESNNEYESKHK